MSGYVYLIGSPKFHWYKIGKSKTPEVRVGDLGILLPFKIAVFGVWKAKNHSLMESSLHEIHAASRINGEWFTFSNDVVESFYHNIPLEACVFWHAWNDESKLSRFSNMERDITSPKKLIKETHNVFAFADRKIFS